MAEPEPSYTKEQLERLAAIAVETKELELRTALVEHQQAVAKALVPDLSDVERGNFAVSGDPAVGTATLNYLAVRRAAEKVVQRFNAPADGQIILVTSDPDLATATATYRDVVASLDAIKAAAADALGPPGGQGESAPETLAFGGQLLATAAAALPGLLKLVTADRALKTAKTDADDLAACAEVARAGSAKGGRWLHADFRMAGSSALPGRLANLLTIRSRLFTRKLELVGQTDEAARARRELCESTLTQIDSLITSLRPVAGVKRSMWSTAELGELLFTSKPSPWVLLVKANAGSTIQVTDNRPLWFDDKVFSMAEASITYILIDSDDSKIAQSGTESGRAHLRADVDDEVEIK